MRTGPPLLSRLGCGALMLLVLVTPASLISLAVLLEGGGLGDLQTAFLGVGTESYTLGTRGLLIAPLAVVSVIAALRLLFGHRDWLPPILSGLWLGIAATFAIETRQFNLLILTAVITLLLTSGIRADRRLDTSDGHESSEERNG